jgi:hypothetical protein
MNRCSRLRIGGALLLILTAGAGAISAPRRWQPRNGPRRARPMDAQTFRASSITRRRHPSSVPPTSGTRRSSATRRPPPLSGRTSPTASASTTPRQRDRWAVTTSSGTSSVRESCPIGGPPLSPIPRTGACRLTPAAEAREPQPRTAPGTADGPEMRDASGAACCQLGPPWSASVQQHVNRADARYVVSTGWCTPRASFRSTSARA